MGTLMDLIVCKYSMMCDKRLYRQVRQSLR